jgi:hypothetical protein
MAITSCAISQHMPFFFALFASSRFNFLFVVPLASQTFAQKALAYGMPTIQVDGNDHLAVNAATREAADRARRNEGPSFIEAVTYRLGDHTTADDARRRRPPISPARSARLGHRPRSANPHAEISRIKGPVG